MSEGSSVAAAQSAIMRGERCVEDLESWRHRRCSGFRLGHVLAAMPWPAIAATAVSCSGLYFGDTPLLPLAYFLGAVNAQACDRCGNQARTHLRQFCLTASKLGLLLWRCQRPGLRSLRQCVLWRRLYFGDAAKLELIRGAGAISETPPLVPS